MKIGDRVKGKRSGKLATIIAEDVDPGWWQVRYDDGLVYVVTERDMDLFHEPPKPKPKPKLKVGMIVTNKHESTEIRYRLIEESAYGNTPCWICEGVGGFTTRLKYKAEDLIPVVSDEYGDSYTAKPQVKFLPSVDQSKPVVVAKNDFLAEAEKRIADLKLELDRASVTASSWELRYGEGYRANKELKADNTALLAENARLRRALEKLERQKK